MAEFGQLYLTDKGLALQMKAQTGEAELEFTRVGIGGGQLNGQSIIDLSVLVDEVMSLPIFKIVTEPVNKAVITTAFNNQGLTEGFYFRELGIFANDPDEGEILYSYSNAGSGAEFIPPSGGSQIIEKQLNLITVVGNAQNVSAVIDGSLTYVLRNEIGQPYGVASYDDLTDHMDDKNNPHDVTSQQINVIEPIHANEPPNSYPKGISMFTTTPFHLYPSSSGTIVTHKGGDNSYTSQTLYDSSETLVYYRIGAFSSDGWGEWLTLETTKGAQRKVDNHAANRNDPHGAKAQAIEWAQNFGLGGTPRVVNANDPDIETGFYCFQGGTSWGDTTIVYGVHIERGTNAAQIAIRSATNETRTRVRLNGQWSDWIQLASTLEVDDLRELVRSVGVGRMLEAVDADDPNLLSGFYAFEDNYPEQSDGIVYGIHLQRNTEWATQIVARATQNRVYTRSRVNGVWRPWIELLTTESLVDNLANYQYGDGRFSSSVIKYIGSMTTGGTTDYILLCPRSDDGGRMTGIITGMRSSASDNNNVGLYMVQASVGRSGASRGASVVALSTRDAGERLVTLTYNSVSYIALEITRVANREYNELFFRGESANLDVIQIVSSGDVSNVSAYDGGNSQPVSILGTSLQVEGVDLKEHVDDQLLHKQSYGVTQTGQYANAEGMNTVASGNVSHAEGMGTTAGGTSSHAEGVDTVAIGEVTHAEGQSTISSGQASHAEGYGTVAGSTGTPQVSSVVAAGLYAHAEGNGTKAQGNSSHAEGKGTLAQANNSHAEGLSTVAGATGSHAEGHGSVTGNGVPSYNGSLTAGVYAHAEGDGTKASGAASHAEGRITEASGMGSHAEGEGTQASGAYTHAEGYNAAARGQAAHAEGSGTLAQAANSHAEGVNTTARGAASHAGGHSTIAHGNYSHASGQGTTADSYASFALGRYNRPMEGTTTSFNVNTDALVIGNGSAGSRSNAFRVRFNGSVFGLSAFNSTGADYAEYFEWLDGNEENEDRVGYFVTLDGEKIKKADSTASYVLGIISAQPAIIGDSHQEDWHQRYLTDEWGRVQCEWREYEEEETNLIQHEEEYDNDGNVVKEAYMEEVKEIVKRKEYVPVVNPNWNPEEEYVPREQRKEWSPVGMVGKLLVRDDGTCQVNGYCMPNDDGIATSSENGYRVMERISDNIVRVLLK